MDEEKELREYLFKEVEIVQDVISRMANNCFLIKGWSITLIVATLLIKGVIYHRFLSFIPLIIFWGLDAYYLQQERAYRKLYEWLIANRLNSNEFLFDMKAYERFKKEVPCKLQLLFSKSILPFYFTLLIILICCIVYFDFQILKF
ncbi:MAG: hypothetical protein ACFFDT_12660 [Candidatus Hodarchaeota archaeon]